MKKSKKSLKHLVTEIQITLFVPKIKQDEIPKKEDYDYALIRVRPGSVIYPLTKLPDYIKNEKNNFPAYRGEFLRVTRTFNPLTGAVIYSDNRNLKLPSKLWQNLEKFLGERNFKITREGDNEYIKY